MSLRSASLISLVAMGLLAPSQVARADLLTLTNGGELRGELLTDGGKPVSAKSAEVLEIRTLSGAVIAVERSQIARVIRRRLVIEEYETLRKATPETAADLWQLAEWCRQKSLRAQREQVLARIVELDPRHEAAHRGLGHVQHEGRWTTRDEIMTSRGYVKHKGKWVLPQELALLLQEEQAGETAKGWYRKINMWRGWLYGDRAERQAQALASLRDITDPHAVPALYKAFHDDPLEDGRLLYVQILGQIEGPKPLGPLVTQSIRDESSAVRLASLKALKKNSESRQTWPVFIKALKHDLNVVVNRAAAALGELGDESVVPPLVEALITRHKYRMRVPDQNPFGFRSDGGGMVPSNQVVLPPDIAVMLATGQLPQGVQINNVPPPGQELRTKVAVVRKDEQNPAVRAALTQLTGNDFGFDRAAWKNWLQAKGQLPTRAGRTGSASARPASTP